MKERDTAIIPARVKKETIVALKQRAGKSGMSVNQWLNWAIDNGLRKHGKSSPQCIESKSCPSKETHHEIKS